MTKKKPELSQNEIKKFMTACKTLSEADGSIPEE